MHEAIRDEQDSKVKVMLQLAADQLRIANSEIEKIETHDGAGDLARRGTSPAGGGAAPAVSTVGGAWGSAGGNAAPEPPEESLAWSLGGGPGAGDQAVADEVKLCDEVQKI